MGGGELETTLKNRPNLLIKGNNLIALHSLKEYFRHQSEQNKVKLIYIDPPYNTGSDSFNYNDRFNHSTYLTFIKNRLEIARELLRDDGVIFVQCDDNEQAYLKVLMDEIFGRENFVACFVWRKKYGGGKGANLFVDTHEYILIYGKNKANLVFNPLKRDDKQLEIFKLEDEYLKERGRYYTRPLKSGLAERKTLIYPIECPDGSFIETQWICAKDTFEQLKKEGRIVFKLLKDKTYNVYKKFYENDMEGVLQESIIYDLTFNADAKMEIKKLFNIQEGRDTPFNSPKPEKLLQRILEITTQENDLVLDFFAGSGTTLAVAHKMKRRYIGIEQMEYIESITKERLKKVIEGEQGGISKAVSWSGGGNLIYCELASLNAKFIEKIENSSDENELNQIYENLQKLAFIDYRVDIKNDLKDDEFSNLDFINKKRILKKCLDRNMDYIPYADMDDSEYKIDERAKKLNKIFYGENDG